MAFGKDPSGAQAMSPRQQLKYGTNRAPRTGGGGGGGALYRDAYRAPDDGTTDLVRIIPGAYLTPLVDFDAKDYVYDENNQIVQTQLPYFKYINYYFAPRKYTIIGSEGPLGEFKGKGEPCLAADWFWYEWRMRGRTSPPSKSPNTLNRTEKFAITTLVQAPFYKVPQMKNGVIQMNETTKQPYMEWAKGSTRGNDEYAAGNYDKKDGHLMHWSMNFMHWNTMRTYANSLACHCRSCGTHDSIRELALVCRSCGEGVVEFATTTLSDSDLIKVREDKVLCPQCKFNGFLDNIIECENCNQGDEATLFDFDLEVSQVKSSENSKNSTLQITKAIGPRAIPAMYGPDLRKPLDLPKIFQPFSAEKQLSVLGQVPQDPAQEQGQGQGQQRTPDTGGTRNYSK